ncbi:YebC/PmpR family DNA-binding transcriptional regulator [Candidatus Beckwithbacteria bacterium CG10_big_fil_rev_8_21_14_0_10_34_10]|uniref:Probable transcriptional regulatory protein COT75_05400 n=1 Tax=Candidatus Beckwithbacteria bacterium CG10_big_fil_rev_8_21_14_0_10_34_10 TaxID=1974495 RepID=A0A2H0W7Z9_9BACT|nr:MAG: YebC/PmpR family DNA-binding transcriptional regulator [Candidatus Beckwithbacteria bacterium CG10_big_fil_rev_8_21_14_0_10_34_10]
MSGHSKWSTIKHDKGIADKKRGKIFSKLAKAVTLAVKEGGDDINSNAKLRFAIDQARQSNMPNDNIKRAIKRGSGAEKGSQLEEIVYEGFGPQKIALIIESITDNRNRTSSDLKTFLEKRGGVLASQGAVTYLFKRKGQILVEKETDLESQTLKLIDLGIDDFEEEEGFIVLYVQSDKLDSLRKQILALNFNIKEAMLIYKAETLMVVEEKDKQEKIINFLKELEELDDVQTVYCNADFPG